MAQMSWKTSEEIEAEKKEAEYLVSLPSEVEQLKAQIKVMDDKNNLLEEALLEMAREVYK